MVKIIDTKTFIRRAKEIHGDKYNYSKSKYVKSHDKIIIICPEHGEFKQPPATHIHQKGGCPLCAGKIKTTSQFIEKAKKVHGDKYNYSKIKYKKAHEKIKYICSIHGEIEQIAINHLKGHGCKFCGKHNTKKPLTTPQFIEKAKVIHGNKYNYSKTKYIGTQIKSTIICPQHGEFKQIPNTHLGGGGCPICSNFESKFEIEICDFIEKICDDKVLKRNRKILNGKELDIYLPNKNIAIECNGTYWHSDLLGKDKLYHLNKTNQCLENNIQLIHIFEHTWNNKKQIFKSYLKRILNGCDNVFYARKCTVKKINNDEIKEFLNNNHLQTPQSGKVNLGLFYENNLISVMNFSKPRFSKKYEWELLRYAPDKNSIIFGGALKMLKFFINKYNPNNIISYCDISIFSGEIYNKMNFNLSHISPPNYWYFKNGGFFHRTKFQKHKLPKILEVFDPNLTEWENMKNNGWNRYWDCGNQIWEWNK